MKAIFLAAGRGSRMENLTDRDPKCLLKVWDRSLLSRNIETLLVEHGSTEEKIEEVGIVVGYQGYRIVEAMNKELMNREETKDRIHFFENLNWAQDTMVGTLFCAREWLEKESCIVSYADILYSQETISALKSSHGSIVVVYDLDWYKLWNLRFSDPMEDAETFELDTKTGRLVSIGGKTKNRAEIQGQYMGLLKIEPEGFFQMVNLFKELKQRGSLRDFDMTAFLQKLIEKGCPIDTVAIRGQWFEFDRREDWELFESDRETFYLH